MKKQTSLFFIAAVFTFISCSDPGINLFTDADEVALGADLHTQIKGNPQEYPIFTGDPAVKAYINQRIFQHIINSPKIVKKDIYNYQFEIINQDILNAFAIPGGYIYLYTGLLKYLDSEAALAGVIGHEIAHIERRHATQRLTAYYGISILLGLILGENPSQLAEIAANLFVGLTFLANSRADENESDQLSFDYLRDTRYYPGGVKFFFEKMRDDGLVSQQSDKIATFLSTHPDPIDRIAIINQRLTDNSFLIVDYKSNSNGIYRDEYQSNISSKLP